VCKNLNHRRLQKRVKFLFVFIKKIAKFASNLKKLRKIQEILIKITKILIKKKEFEHLIAYLYCRGMMSMLKGHTVFIHF